MKLFERNTNDHSHDQTSDVMELGQVPDGKGTSDQEVATVIALALQLYINELREYEKTVITIQQAIRPYSPWSSKIYGLRQQPNYIPALKSRLK